MWHINSITVPAGYGAASIYGGSGTNVSSRNAGDRFGPQGSTYFFSVEGLGSFFLEDVGAIGGSGAWAIQLNGGSTYWYYNGEGQGDIVVNTDGTFTISGGTGSVNGSLIINMQDTGPLTQAMVTMVMGSSALQQDWKNSAINTLYMMGFPESCMINMDMSCCAQFTAALQNITFQQVLTEEEHLQVKQGLGGWWSCTLCIAFELGLMSATAVVIAAVIIALAPASAVAALEGLSEISLIAASRGLAVGKVAAAAGTTFAAVGFARFVEGMADSLCQMGGLCDSAYVRAQATSPTPTID